MLLVLVLFLIGISGQTQLLTVGKSSQLDSYGRSSSACTAKVGYPLIGLVCDSTLNFGMFGKLLNHSALTDLPTASTDRFVIMEDHLLALGKRNINNKAEVTVNITRYEVRSKGESPSFEASYKFHLFRRSILDASIHAVTVDNSYFIFCPVIIEKPEEDSSPVKERKYFDPFEERLLQSFDTPQTRIRWLTTLVYDKDHLELFKISEINFAEFTAIQSWESLKIVLLTRFGANRIVFLAVFDDSKVFLIATKKNSLALNVVYHSEYPKKIRALATANDQLFLLTDGSIEVCGVDKQKLAAIVESFDKEVKIDTANKDYLDILQRIPLDESLVNQKALTLKILPTDFKMILIAVSNSHQITMFGSHIKELKGEDESIKSIISQFYDIGSVKIDSRVLDYQFLTPATLNMVDMPDNLAHQLTIATQDDKGLFYKHIVPLCPPNRVLNITEHFLCSTVESKESSFMLGMQSNEMKVCGSQANTSSAIAEAFLCPKLPNEQGSTLDEVGYLSELNRCLISVPSDSESKTCLYFDQRAFKVNCSLFTDCHNCSMINSCFWNSQNSTCENFVSGNTTELQIEESKYLSKHLFETGSMALDLAGLKIYSSCAKRDDIDVKFDTSGDFTNVSIGSKDPEETILIVGETNTEKRVFHQY